MATANKDLDVYKIFVEGEKSESEKLLNILRSTDSTVAVLALAGIFSVDKNNRTRADIREIASFAVGLFTKYLKLFDEKNYFALDEANTTIKCSTEANSHRNVVVLLDFWFENLGNFIADDDGLTERSDKKYVRRKKYEYKLREDLRGQLLTIYDADKNYICKADENIINDFVYKMKLHSKVNDYCQVNDGLKLLVYEGYTHFAESLSINIDPSMAVTLRKWRDEFSFHSFQRWMHFVLYNARSKAYKALIKSIGLYRRLNVPMFVDDFGTLMLRIPAENAKNDWEELHIDVDAGIFHCTHDAESKEIVRQGFKASNNKNTVKGVWFFWNNGKDLIESPYGNKCFETTFDKLGITGLERGEIVGYKNEINVILYPSKEKGFEGLCKPTSSGAKKILPKSNDVYVNVSVFVPEEYLPEEMNEFKRKVDRPKEVLHSSMFCIRKKRDGDCEMEEMDDLRRGVNGM